MPRYSYDHAPSHTARNLIAALIVIIIIALGYAGLRGSAPRVKAEVPPAIGANKMIDFQVTSSTGVAAVEAHYVQNGKTIPLGRRTFAARRWFSTGGAPEVVHFDLQAGVQNHPEVKDGPATLVFTAESANLRGASTTVRRDIKIETTPPAVYSLSSQQYVVQGGAGMLVYHVSASASVSGVTMGGIFFPGYRLPHSKPGTMFCLFAYPWNAPPGVQARLIARDAAGNQATTTFPIRTYPQKFRSRPMTITDNFIERVVMPIIAHMPSLHKQASPLDDFLMVNKGLRASETAQLFAAAKQTRPQFFWHGRFLQLPNSQVEARFADHRSYVYDGKVVDQESHLGYDLASVEHAPVPAANAGRVVWTKYFGIYGNCILLDHGYGLMTLYGHLNDFTVKPGQMVAKGQIIAHTDSTGLAGGDHLHFSVLLDGLQVNPTEWWDPHWIKVHITDKIANFSNPPAA